LPLIDLLKDAFGVDETDSEHVVAEKIEARAPAGGAPYIRHLLGVGVGDSSIADLDAQLRKARTFDALLEFLREAAAEMPHVVVIEDLHWMDHASTEFLSFFVEAVKALPIMVILTHRPEWESPLGMRPYFTRLDLQNLSEDDSAAIGAGVAGGALPGEVERLIYGKAEGNPFFVEEITRSLVEMGALHRDNGGYELARPIDEIEVPNTVQGVIMARLDRLEEDPRRALQTASVIGREFTVRLLEKIAALPNRAEASLRELRALELIYERSLYPELQYMFKHALTHDVAYSSLLIARRKALHAVVASAIEELYADRLAEHYEMIAFHAEQGENWPLAFEYLVRSADKALQAFAPGSTHEFCQRALAIAARGDVHPSQEQLLHIHSSDGQALYLVSRFADSAAAFAAAEQIARGLGDELAEGVALFHQAMSLHWGHRFDEAMAAAERARAIGIAHGNDAVLAGSLMTIDGVHAVRGDQEAVTSVMREASEVAARSQVPLLEGVTAVWEGFVHHWRGEEQRALEIWGRGEHVAREHQLAIVQLWTFWNRALALIGTGAYDEALASLHEHLTLTERLGERAFRCRTLNTLGWLHIDLCDWDRAIEYNRQGAELSRQVGDPEIIRNAEINLGECFLRIGDLDESQRCLERVEREAAKAAAWGEEWMKWRYMQHLHVVLSEVWLARGDAGRALEYAERCIQQAEATSSPRNIAKGRRARANALRALGREAEAQADFEASLAAAREVGTPAQIWQTLEALGRPSDALAVLDDMAAGLADDHLRTTLLASAEYARVRAAAEQQN
jgi:predicted ATPase